MIAIQVLRLATYDLPLAAAWVVIQGVTSHRDSDSDRLPAVPSSARGTGGEPGAPSSSLPSQV